jgi:hypothetical protein
MAGGRIALLDASVLYPAPLRDLLMHLAEAGLFRAKWTDAIHDEWTRAVLRHRPDLRRERLERTRALMEVAVPDARVEGYEGLVARLTLPDADDRHVLAAAIHVGASVIVTANLADFPAAVLAPFGCAAQHPDAFVCQLIAESAERVCGAVRLQRGSLRSPPKTAREYLSTLERQGLVRTVAALRGYVAEL